MNFTQQELINMVYCIGEADRNVLLASRIYQQKYPDAITPQVVSVQRLRELFERSGTIKYKKKELLGRRIDEETELNVLLKLQENPNVSTREITAQLDVSQSSVNRIILKHRFHPYHVELHQELHGEDFHNRMNFSEVIRDMINENRDFLNRVLFSDEATFKSNGNVNRHNMHYYSIDNPHWLRAIDQQNRWSLNVWGGIIGTQVIGPFFFDGVLDGIQYVRFLQENLPILLENVDLNTRREMWLQQDGAPVHYHRIVRHYLDEAFHNRWIGRRGPIAWPARSPDLTPIDFFLWGYIKEKVYRVRPTTAEDMRNRITEAFQSITENMLARVRLSFERRLTFCIEENGGLFEHLH